MGYSHKVSIIMPAYNAGDFIAESIESVINQEFVDWELIIVNDNSKDNTVEVVTPYLADERINLINNSVNLGGAASRNVAIKESKGRYIAFLDSDDLWFKDKLGSHIEFMTKNEIGFTYSNYYQFHGDESNTLITAPNKVNYDQMLLSNFIGCLTVVYDTAMFGKFYFPETKKRHDFALWLNMLKKFDYAYNVGFSLARYRVHSASLSSNKKDAFQSYFHVLHTLQNVSYFKALYYTFTFTCLSILKKKHSSLYFFTVNFLIKGIKF
ncbi:glycosyltransferase family 2 protein [uncultured Pseudoalteromonas sp.]|uniref:glycosyltransferase family 2 protein n=1 Tax=uncultured Pseudoalteromonas sp. TaxID=114053 RepID=UPI0032B2F7EC